MVELKRIYFVASRAPRVGKTLTVRLLSGYFKYNRRRVFALHLGHHDVVKDGSGMTYDDFCEIDTTIGQMRCFERLLLKNEGVKVVDVGAESRHRMIKLSRQLEFFEEACLKGYEIAF